MDFGPICESFLPLSVKEDIERLREEIERFPELEKEGTDAQLALHVGLTVSSIGWIRESSRFVSLESVRNRLSQF